LADRQVTHTRKDVDGDIVVLCNPLSSWILRAKDGALEDIEHGVHTYYVESNGSRVYVQAVDWLVGKRLETTTDPTSASNLRNLPDG
jgi:hypothetical protein